MGYLWISVTQRSDRVRRRRGGHPWEESVRTVAQRAARGRSAPPAPSTGEDLPRRRRTRHTPDTEDRWQAAEMHVGRPSRAGVE